MGGMTSPFLELLVGLARQRGVQGGLIVSERDGIVVDAHVQIGVRANVIAALAASIFRKARQAADAAGLDGVNYLELVAEHGRLCMAGRGDLVIVVITDARATIGLLRTAVLRASEALA
jgi:predicted regulator of Ras-like GTPase activity (Roadblock/LC7/MglB family)